VPRPDLARPVPGAVSVLSRLAARYAIVAVISGRPPDQVRALLGAPEVTVVGLYGLPEGARSNRVEEALTDAEAICRDVAGSWLEDKGQSLAVHFRSATEPAEAEKALRPRLEELARARGLMVLPGKMVFELAPGDTPGKGAVVLREARARRLAGCVYAGDDRADLVAFAAVDELRASGVHTLKVAVRSEETPAELIRAADIVVERPAGLVELLSGL
jgi:trehalose 6-phosphate phosphatase